MQQIFLRTIVIKISHNTRPSLAPKLRYKSLEGTNRKWAGGRGKRVCLLISREFDVARRYRPYLFTMHSLQSSVCSCPPSSSSSSDSRLRLRPRLLRLLLLLLLYPCANWRRIYGVEILMPRVGWSCHFDLWVSCTLCSRTMCISWQGRQRDSYGSPETLKERERERDFYKCLRVRKEEDGGNWRRYSSDTQTE